MLREKLPFNIKKLCCCVLFLITLAASVYLVFTITACQMKYLSYLLYDKSHLSAVYRLLNQFVLRKLLFGVVFFLIALVMLYLFYFSFYQLTYLKLSILCLLCILYCSTLTETNTIFYIGSSKGQIWQNAGLVSCIFLILFYLFITFESLLEKCSSLLVLIPLLAYGALSIFMLSRRYARNLQLVPFLFLGLFGLSLCYTFICLLFREFRTFLWSVPVIGSSSYLLYANYIYRLRNYTVSVMNQRASLYDATVYFAAFISLYLVFSMLVQKRNLLMHSRQLNRQIMDLEHSKSLLLGVLYSNVKNHLYSAKSSLDTLSAAPGLSSEAEKNARELKIELDNIGTLYNQVHNYTIFSGNNIHLHQNHVNTELFFRTLVEKFRHSGLLSPEDSVETATDCAFVDFTPEYLLPCLEDLVILLRQQNPSGHLTLRMSLNLGQVVFSLLFSSPWPMSFSSKQSLDFFLRPQFNSVPDLTSLDYCVSLLRHQAKAAGGFVRVSGDQGFSLKIYLPVSDQGAAPYYQESFPCRNPQIPARKSLLFVTSDPAQMEDIKKILPFDRYHITLANDCEYFLSHLSELSAYSLIITGNLYRNVYFRDFYNCVRKDYPMTSLPILMLLPDLYAENSFYIRSTINDYLLPPYSQTALSKKIHSLVTVKKTTDIALETQMEFWQSQINPHFIFNSINSIMQMCIKEPMKAYELLGDFSEYLRGHLLSLSLNKSSTIQKEIDLISAYLEIEKARFGDKIHYELDIDCARDFPILPLLIEPLVENSIKHSPMHESGVTVGVRIFQMDDRLLVQVQDDGNGMSHEIIRQILSNTFVSNSIGLSNVCSRLRYYYHTVPVIESTPGQGTTVQFTINKSSTSALKGDLPYDSSYYH